MNDYNEAMAALNKAINADIQKMQRAEANDTDSMPLVARIMDTHKAMRILKHAWERAEQPADEPTTT